MRQGGPLLERFVDVYEQVTRTLLPVKLCLKSIAVADFEIGVTPQANGLMYLLSTDQWLGWAITFLDVIQRYNEDDCRATRHVKDWLVNFVDATHVGTRLNRSVMRLIWKLLTSLGIVFFFFCLLIGLSVSF